MAVHATAFFVVRGAGSFRGHEKKRNCNHLRCSALFSSRERHCSLAPPLGR
jgi:hypothetical protein